MIAASVLLAILAPGPAEAPWRCNGYVQEGDLLIRVMRHLTPDGRTAGDFVSWEPGQGAATWQMGPDSATAYRLDSLGFFFTLTRRPARPLRLRIEADGRVISRLSVHPRIYEDRQARPRADIVLVRSPDAYRITAGSLPEIGWVRRVTGRLEERGGAILGTITFALPDPETLAARARPLWAAARGKAADYRRQCTDMRGIFSVPARQPS